MQVDEHPGLPTSLWRNRDYMLLWSGQVVSVLGSSVSGIVIPLLILALTNSPNAAGIAGALVTLPYVLFSLPAGALVDRWDRKRVMIVTDLGRALAMISIPVAMLFQALTIWQMYVVSFIEGTLFVFFNIAEVAALPRVVPKRQLGDATSQNMATFAVASLLGPGLGGFLYQAAGRAVPFVLDAVSYIISALSLVRIKAGFQGTRERERGSGLNLRKMRAEIGEGLVWAWNEPLVRFTSFLSGGMNFVLAGSFLIIIVLAKQMEASEAEIGSIFSIGAIGGIIGAAMGGRINKRFSIRQIVIATTWLTVLVFPLLAFAPNVVALGAISLIVFLSIPIYSVAVLSYRLALIPDELQGRVNSAVRLAAFGFQPLGSWLAGLLLEQVGAVPSVWAFSGVMLALGISALLNPLNPRVVTATAQHRAADESTL